VPLRDIEGYQAWVTRERPTVEAQRRVVQVWYRHVYADDAVDVLAVTAR
jgi:hypothetical protein